MLEIEKYYEEYDEDSRLIKDNSHKVEFITTTRLLDEKIKAGSKILDVGAGTGRYSLYGDDRDCFYFSTYDEIDEMMTKFKVEKLDHVDIDGIVHMMRDNINSLDENEFNKWLDYHFKTCRNTSIIGYSLHNLYVCKKSSTFEVKYY